MLSINYIGKCYILTFIHFTFPEGNGVRIYPFQVTFSDTIFYFLKREVKNIIAIIDKAPVYKYICKGKEAGAQEAEAIRIEKAHLFPIQPESAGQ